jgi:DNA replication regulator SLD3
MTLLSARLIFHAELPNNPQSPWIDGESRTVSVVRQAPNGRLYAVEALGGNTHVGCLLAEWVTEEQVFAGRGSLSEKFVLEKLMSGQQDSETRENSSKPSSQHGLPVQPFRPSPKKPKNKRGVLARMSIMPSKEITPKSQSPVLTGTEQRQQSLELDTAQPTVNGNVARHIMHTSPVIPAQDSLLTSNNRYNSDLEPLQQQRDDPALADLFAAVPPNAQTILETMHRQYLETLYTSKTSLAYFAKGPLVRARTQIQSIPTSRLSDLADFCRESLIPTKKMDLKYRDSIVRILQDLALLDAPSGTEELQKVSTKPRAKQKSTKQRKIGKDGLYPAEKAFILSWWHGRTLRDSDVPTVESRTGEIKNAVADLRSRETEMQVLLILEALALEGAEKPSVAGQTTGPLIKEERSEQGQDVALIELPQFKKKKRQDLRCELDLLVDRMCIWHTVGLEEISKSSHENQNLGDGPDARSRDRLRNFCLDVIIPFYSARLPEQCKAVCQKLGGPQISPKRPRKLLQKSLSSSRILPGPAVKPSRGSISKRTLQRVLSEDQGSRHGSPPVLSRSSTAPLVPTLKRETTEPPQRPESRGGLQKSRSFANREIDLVSDARTQDVKQKKLANLAKQKREIDAAINALRKPNRGLAAKEIADEIERHRVEGANLTRHYGLSIQVNATPKKPKHNIAEQAVGFRSGPSATRPLPEPSMNELSVPSSMLRPSMADQVNGRLQISSVRRAAPTAVSDTPGRESSKRSDPLGSAKPTQGFPIFTVGSEEVDYTNKVEFHTESLIQATPSANRLRPDMLTSIQNTPLRMKKSQKPVLFTAMKKADITIDDVFKDAPEIPEQAGKTMARVMGGGSEMSIYDSLGWNDDFDD